MFDIDKDRILNKSHKVINYLQLQCHFGHSISVVGFELYLKEYQDATKIIILEMVLLGWLLVTGDGVTHGVTFTNEKNINKLITYETKRQPLYFIQAFCKHFCKRLLLCSSLIKTHFV